MACPICTETFNLSSRKQVTCLKCSNACCRKCAQRYLLELASTPHCMSCKHAWDIKFLMDNLTKTFVAKKYKDRRKDLLFDIEKSRIPSTMPQVERFLEIEKLKEQNMILHRQKRELQAQCRALDNQIWQNQYRIHHGKDKKIHAKFTQPCPIADCKGFLSTAWKCQVCATNICAQCREIKGEDHVCNEDNVKTAALLKKDTKPCPSCGEGIFKISGCDQMWCTQCKVPFSWKTGRLVTGTVHNPHYYQFMRDHQGAVPRNPADVRCGGMPTPYQFNVRLRARVPKQMMIRVGADRYKARDYVYVTLRNLSHFRLIVLPRLREKTTQNTEQKRVLYILNRLDEKKFKTALAKNDTAVRKNTDIYNIYNLVNTVCTEQHINMYNNMNTLTECLNTCEQLRLYANAELAKLRKIYRHRILAFNPWFELKAAA